MHAESPVRQLAKRSLEAMLPRSRFLVRGPASSPLVALTFDDGPDPEHTPRLLDVLATLGVAATFFVIGERAERHPEIVRRAAREGHAIGHHSWTHGRPEAVSADTLLAEVQRAEALVADLTGRPSRLFRPPYGKVTAAKLGRLVAAGQTTVLWNVDPRDYEAKSEDELRASWSRLELRRGDVVLLHDTFPHAAATLPEVVTTARARGLSLGTVERWIG